MTLKVWIAEILISDRVVHKIQQKHGVAPRQVREACLFFAYRMSRDPRSASTSQRAARSWRRLRRDPAYRGFEARQRGRWHI
jgi:hypothetical protein